MLMKVELNEIINKIIIAASSWLFVLLVFKSVISIRGGHCGNLLFHCHYLIDTDIK